MMSRKMISLLLVFSLITSVLAGIPLSVQAEETGSTVLEGKGEVLYQSDFSDWESGWDTFRGNDDISWSVNDGKMSVTPGYGTKAAARDKEFTDFVYEVDITVDERRNAGEGTAQAGVLFRVKDIQHNTADGHHGYYFGIDAQSQGVILGRSSGNSWNEIASRPADIEYGKSYHITIVVAGSHIRCYVGDTNKYYAKIDVTDTTHASGSVGMRTWNAGGSYENVKVSAYTEPTMEGDTYTNPILPMCADPDVLYYKGTYYLYPTNAGDANDDEGIKVYTSTDLVHWTDKGLALKKGDDIWGTRNFWAPDIIERDGIFYMYYTAEERLCVATSTSPLGPFKQDEKKPMHQGTPEIDAHAFRDDDGQYYLYFVRFDNGNVIFGAKLNDDMKTIDEDSIVRVLTPDTGWERDRANVNEGPFMLKKDGKYYLTYSGSHFESPNYGAGYAVSDSPLGTYQKYAHNPIMKSNSLAKGTGHHGIVESPDGTELFMVYHRHNDTSTTEPRRLCIDRIRFNEDENGTTILEVSGPTVTPQSVPSGAVDVDNLISYDNPETEHIYALNGTLPDSWGLPTEVTNIITSKSESGTGRAAEIQWDTGSYDPTESDRTQEFTARGTIILPEDVVNLGEIPMIIEVPVTVYAANIGTAILQRVYDEYKNKKAEDYEAGNDWDAFAQALETARNILESVSETPQETIDEATAALRQAVEKLVRRTYTINGKIEKGNTEASLEGIEVSLYQMNGGIAGTTPLETALTDSDGNFAFTEKLLPGAFRLVIEKTLDYRKVQQDILITNANIMRTITLSPVLYPKKLRLEAEDAVMTGTARVANDRGASGGKSIGWIDDYPRDTVTFHLNVPAAGTYTIEMGSWIPWANGAHRYYVNGDTENMELIDYRANINEQKRQLIEVELLKGNNTFTVTHAGINESFTNLDYIDLYYATEPQVNGLTLDGMPLTGFTSALRTYEIERDDLTDLPQLGIQLPQATAQDYDVTLIQGKTAKAILTHKLNPEIQWTYTVRFIGEKTMNSSIVNFGADPWITWQDGWYYYCRVNKDRAIYVSRAKELNRVAQGEPHLVYAPSEDEPSAEMWAPEMHFLNGKWYIYYTAGAGANHRMYVLEGEDPLGAFTFKGKVTPTTDRWAIDQTVLEYDGKMYAIWSGWPGNEDVTQRIYIAEMSNPWTITGERVELSRPEYSWEVNGGIPTINEGAQIVTSPDGVVNIVYSASGSWTDDYCLGRLTLRGENPMDPGSWEKGTESIFHKNASDTYSTGHASFTKSPDGTEDYIVFHANRGTNQSWNGRGVRVQDFSWNEDGTPNFGEAVSYNGKINIPAGTPEIERSRYEAEDGELTDAQTAATYNSSGGNKVTGMTQTSSGVTFHVMAEKKGSYKLYLAAASGTEGAALAVKIDQEAEIVKEVVPFNVNAASGVSPDNWMGYELDVLLNKGEHTISVGKAEGKAAADLDYIELELVEEIMPVKNDLQVLYDQHKNKKAEDYASGWEAFEEALRAAKTVLDLAEADEEAINTALDTLLEAAANLVEKQPVIKPDKGELRALYDQHKDKKAEDYASGWEAFEEALRAAKTVLDLEDADEEAIKGALDTLTEAAANLVEKQPIIKPDKGRLQALYNQHKGKKAEDYTSGWNAFEAALKAAKTVLDTEEANQDTIDAAAAALEKAIAGLVPVKPDPDKPIPKKNAVYKVGKLYYKVTKSDKKNGTVEVTKPVKKTYKSIQIPNSVNLDGYTFKITSIKKKAFSKNKKLKSVKIGDNVSKIGGSAFADCTKLERVTIGKGLQSIGSKAFYKDKKLKRVVIRSSKVKKVYSKAFNGIRKNAVIDVPNKKVKSYKRIFKKGGQAKTVIIK